MTSIIRPPAVPSQVIEIHKQIIKYTHERAVKDLLLCKTNETAVKHIPIIMIKYGSGYPKISLSQDLLRTR